MGSPAHEKGGQAEQLLSEAQVCHRSRTHPALGQSGKASRRRGHLCCDLRMSWGWPGQVGGWGLFQAEGAADERLSGCPGQCTAGGRSAEESGLPQVRGSLGRACGFVPENWESLRVLTRSMASFVCKN